MITITDLIYPKIAFEGADGSGGEGGDDSGNTPKPANPEDKTEDTPKPANPEDKTEDKSKSEDKKEDKKEKIFDPLGDEPGSVYNQDDYKDMKAVLGDELYKASNKEQLKEFVDIAIKHKISATAFKELYDQNVKSYEQQIEKIRIENSKISENLHKEFNMEQSEFIKTLQDGIRKSNLGGLLKKYPMLTNDPDMWKFLANYSRQNSEPNNIDLSTSNDNIKEPDMRARIKKMLDKKG